MLATVAMLARYTILTLLTVPLWGCSQPSLSSSSNTPAGGRSSIAEIAATYTNLQRITESVVYVNPELAMLCGGVPKEVVDHVRVRFGPHANTGILIFMNNLAADAFAKKVMPFPVGSVVL